MSVQKTKVAPPPRWAWLFAATCVAIPVIAVGGAIPTAIGAAGAFYCLAVSRDPKRTTKRRLIHCAAVTVGCWVIFVSFVGGVMTIRSNTPGSDQVRRPQSASSTATADQTAIDKQTTEHQKTIMASEEKRREIYFMAVGLRDDLERANARRADRLARGLDVRVSDIQIAHIKNMQETHLDFTARFHKITREQLEAIIEEGDRMGWPQE